MDKFASKHGSHIEKTANGYKFSMSKKEWQRIGKQAGWIKQAKYSKEKVIKNINDALDIIEGISEDDKSEKHNYFIESLNKAISAIKNLDVNTTKDLVPIRNLLYKLANEMRSARPATVRGPGYPPPNSPMPKASELVRKAAFLLDDDLMLDVEMWEDAKL